MAILNAHQTHSSCTGNFIVFHEQYKQSRDNLNPIIVTLDFTAIEETKI
jgi:tRNA(Phe) wybutosine-synthesizing methylase Tyw3